MKKTTNCSKDKYGYQIFKSLSVNMFHLINYRLQWHKYVIINKHLGVSYSGSTSVSKTASAGSIPATPAIFNLIVKYGKYIY